MPIGLELLLNNWQDDIIIKSQTLWIKLINNKRARLVIFAKTPLPGFAKTRLIPALGELGAARLAEKMLQHTVEQALLAAKQNPFLSVELCITPCLEHSFWEQYAECGLSLSLQCEGDLGDRLQNSAKRNLENHEKVILIGTDCPLISADTLVNALNLLDSHDAVIHPSSDGGYVLLGLTRHHSRLFSDIPWSTEHVFRITSKRLTELGFTAAYQRELHDIDEHEDLIHVPEQWLIGLATSKAQNTTI